jgi:integrase
MRLGHEIDLQRGRVSLDENKTDDARDWAMDPGVVRALAAWVKLRGLQRGDFVFVEENGGAIDQEKLSRRLRSHVRLTGIDRPELLTAGTNRGRLRVHDLRGTFVTLSLAAGKSETWVADRTGHTSIGHDQPVPAAVSRRKRTGLG